MLDVRFYNPANTATGGAINASSILGTLQDTSIQSASISQMHDLVTSDQAGSSYTNFFKKIWIKSFEAVTISNPKVYFSMATYPSQLSLAREKSTNDTTLGATSYPSGYSDSDFLSPKKAEDAVSLALDSSALTAGASKAIWMRIKVPPGAASDPAAAGRLMVRGTKVS